MTGRRNPLLRRVMLELAKAEVAEIDCHAPILIVMPTRPGGELRSVRVSELLKDEVPE
jgi:hypothetical protein